MWTKQDVYIQEKAKVNTQSCKELLLVKSPTGTLQDQILYGLIVYTYTNYTTAWDTKDYRKLMKHPQIKLQEIAEHHTHSIQPVPAISWPGS